MIVDVTVESTNEPGKRQTNTTTVALQIQGGRRLSELAVELNQLPGVIDAAPRQTTE